MTQHPIAQTRTTKIIIETIAFLKERPDGATNAQIRRYITNILSCPDGVIYKELKKLRDEGIIESMGHGRYVLVQNREEG